MLGTIVDVIILVGGLALAIERIYNFFKKTGKGIKQTAEEIRQREEQELNEKIDARLKVILPGILEKHDLEVRQKYLNDRIRYLTEIKDEVVRVMQEKLDAVELHDTQMEVFTEVLKELLRERIMAIYSRNRCRRKLEEHEKIELDRSYASYKSIHGNSYIDEFYEIMSVWDVVPDDIISEKKEHH